MHLTQGLRRSQALYGDRIATIFGERRMRWNVLADRVARLAGALVARGAHAGDRIAILATNSDAYVVAYYAIAWAGCVSVPFNTRWAAAEMQFALDDSSPRLMIVDSTFAGQGEAFARAGLDVIGMHDDFAGPHLEGLIDRSAPLLEPRAAGTDLAGIFYTGGTTGRSKGVMLSHANLVADFLLLQAVAPYDTNTVFLHSPPMFHLADASCLFGLTSLGATHVVLAGFDAATAIDAIEQHRVSAVVLVPTMIGMLCEALRARPADMSSVRRLTYGASAISSSVLQRAMAALPNAQFIQCYGQTELGPVTTVLDHEDHLAGRLRSAGRQIPCTEIKVLDDDLMEAPPGQVGEIAVRGPHVMLGYWNDPEMTEDAFVDGWLRTGDAGYLDPDGYLYLVDRVKDMIVSGGENVYSAEVENALMSHPDVLQCAVIGVPDDRWGERVHAMLYMRQGSTATVADLTAHCGPLIANYKRPKSFEFRGDPLPLSPVGKILKTELRKPFWADCTRNIG